MAADSPMAHKCDMCGAESKDHDEKHVMRQVEK